MTRHLRLVSAMAVTMLVLPSVPAPTNAQTPTDKLQASLSNISPAKDSLKAGAPPTDLAEGAFTDSANTQLDFIYVGTAFAPGAFGSFKVTMQIVTGSGGGGPTTYSQQVTVAQPGAPLTHNLRLTPVTGSFTATGQGALGDTAVNMTIQCGGDAPACPTVDGSTIEGNLHFDGEAGKKLSSTVQVKVRITLVYPTSCLRIYNFTTDMSLLERITSTEVVVVKSGKNAGRVNTTTPYGQLSNNTLIVNTCGTAEPFDLGILLDPSFRTNPHDNPGNAVFTWLAGEEVDVLGFDIAKFSQISPQGQSLCLMNISLPGNSTFLVTVHMGIDRGILAGALTASPFSFTSKLFSAGNGCSTSPLDSASSTISWQLK